MKQHALWFIDCDTVELWEILPEFADMAASYQQFIDAVYKSYPGSDAERCWSIGDMEKLVGEASRVGISSLADLGNYHRVFIAMTTFLIAENHISAGGPLGAPSRKNGEGKGNDDDIDDDMYRETTQVWSGSCDLGT